MILKSNVNVLKSLMMFLWMFVCGSVFGVDMSDDKSTKSAIGDTAFSKWYKLPKGLEEIVLRVRTIKDEKDRERVPFFSGGVVPTYSIDESFFLLGTRGSGKSMFWKSCIQPQLLEEKKNDFFLVEVMSNDIDDALDSFVGYEKETSKKLEIIKNENEWSKDNMVDFVISLMADKVMGRLKKIANKTPDQRIRDVNLDDSELLELLVTTYMFSSKSKTAIMNRYADITKTLLNGGGDEAKNDSAKVSDCVKQFKQLRNDIRVVPEVHKSTILEKVLCLLHGQYGKDLEEMIETLEDRSFKGKRILLRRSKILENYVRLIKKAFSVSDVIIVLDGLDECNTLGLNEQINTAAECAKKDINLKALQNIFNSSKPLLDSATSDNPNRIKAFFLLPYICGKGSLPPFRKNRVVHTKIMEWGKRDLKAYANFLVNTFRYAQLSSNPSLKGKGVDITDTFLGKKAKKVKEILDDIVRDDPNAKKKLEEAEKGIGFLVGIAKGVWRLFLGSDDQTPIFPESFRKLVGGEKCEDIFLEGISTPRGVNKRFRSFITELNKDVTTSNEDEVFTKYVGKLDCSTVGYAIQKEERDLADDDYNEL